MFDGYKFGWLLSGPTPNIITDKMFSTVCQIVTGPSTDNNLNEILKKF